MGFPPTGTRGPVRHYAFYLWFAAFLDFVIVVGSLAPLMYDFPV